MAKKQQKTSQEWGNDDDEDDASDKKYLKMQFCLHLIQQKHFWAFKIELWSLWHKSETILQAISSY